MLRIRRFLMLMLSIAIAFCATMGMFGNDMLFVDVYANDEYFTDGDYTYLVQQFADLPDKYATISKYNGIDKDVIIPSKFGELDVLQIARGAFQDQRFIESVTIPGCVRVIYYDAFQGCVRLKNVSINEGVMQIYGGAFKNCESMESLVLPKTLTDFMPEAVWYTESLQSITFLNPDTFIDSSSIITFNLTFKGTIYGYKDSTAEKYAKKNNYNFQYLDDTPKTTTEPPKTTTTKPKTTTSTSTTTTNPKTTTSTTTTTTNPKTTTSTTTSTTTTTTTTTSTSTTTTTTTVKVITTEFPSAYKTTDDYEIRIDDSGNLIIWKYLGKAYEVYIPSTYDGKTVTSIGSSAFARRKTVRYIRVPDSVEVIKPNAFNSCECLKSVKLSAKIKDIPAYCFYGCSNLEYLSIPSGVEEIQLGAFQLCEKLIKLAVNGSYTRISDSACINKNCIIYGYSGSEAQKYAEAHGNVFRDIKYFSSDTVEYAKILSTTPVVTESDPTGETTTTTANTLITETLDDTATTTTTTTKTTTTIPTNTDIPTTSKTMNTATIQLLGDNYKYSYGSEYPTLSFSVKYSSETAIRYFKCAISYPETINLSTSTFEYPKYRSANNISYTMQHDSTNRTITIESKTICHDDQIWFYFDMPQKIIDLREENLSRSYSFNFSFVPDSIEIYDYNYTKIPYKCKADNVYTSKVYISTQKDKTRKGDATINGTVTVSDAILMSRICAEDKTAYISKQGKLNADVDGKEGITMDDINIVLQFLAGLLKTI